MRNAWAICGWLAILLLTILSNHWTHAADSEPSAARDKKALTALQAYVGGWRGVGQPKRGSNQGAWTEESEWGWKFEKGRAELVGQLSKDKYYSRLRLQPDKDDGKFVLLAAPVAGAEGASDTKEQPERRFVGKVDNGALVLTADEQPPNQKLADQKQDDEPARISVRLVAGGDRMLVLYEKRVAENSYSRLAEVGSTRKGSSFAKSVASGPECVVTGGLGTIAVEYEGKKYYVCCGGCRDLFNDDPAGVLAEYRERKAAERAEKNEKK